MHALTVTLAAAMLAMLPCCCGTVFLTTGTAYHDGSVSLVLTNAASLVPASIRVIAYNHRTGQALHQRFVLAPLVTIHRNLTSRLAFGRGCNLVAVRATSSLSPDANTLMLASCNTSSAVAQFAHQHVGCLASDWMTAPGYGAACAERQARECRIWCCPREAGLCCNTSGSQTVRGEFIDTFAQSTYTSSSGASNWAVNAWTESALPLEDATSVATGSIRVSAGALTIACSPDSIRCLLGLDASVQRIVPLPVCLGTAANVTVSAIIDYVASASYFVATLGGHASRVLAHNVTRVTINTTVSAAISTPVLIIAITGAGTVCHPPPTIAVSRVTITSACVEPAQPNFSDRDTCGVCGGSTVLYSNCPTGTSTLFAIPSLRLSVCSFSGDGRAAATAGRRRHPRFVVCVRAYVLCVCVCAPCDGRTVNVDRW